MSPFKSFNLNDEDAVDKLKEASKGSLIELDEKGVVKYFVFHKNEEIKPVFRLDRGKVECIFNKLYNLLNELENKGILTILEKKYGLFQTAKYAFEDAQSAIDSYKSIEIIDFSDNSYILLYGLFQALIIQQDAVKTLFNLILDKQLDVKTDYPTLENIRTIRNNSTGHPTNRFHGKRYFLISAPTLNKTGYYLVEHNQEDQKRGKQIHVYPKLLYEQEEAIVEILDFLMNELEKLLGLCKK